MQYTKLGLLHLDGTIFCADAASVGGNALIMTDYPDTSPRVFALEVDSLTVGLCVASLAPDMQEWFGLSSYSHHEIVIESGYLVIGGGEAMARWQRADHFEDAFSRIRKRGFVYHAFLTEMTLGAGTYRIFRPRPEAIYIHMLFDYELDLLHERFQNGGGSSTNSSISSVDSVL